ncbi:DUF166 domain-containing protein, partial [Thermodesulfobacteriota bacterium]
RIVIVYTNAYGRRFQENLEKRAPKAWEIVGYLFDRPLPAIIDDPEECMPPDIPEGDLLIYVGQDKKPAELVADIAVQSKVKEVIVGVDNRAYFPTGLANQVLRRLRKKGISAVFPAPFCTLDEETAEGPLTKEFARLFGRPGISVQIKDEAIGKVSVSRGAPCGNTHYVAEGLPGCQAEESVEEAARLFHGHPCMGSMDMDRELGDTMLHVAGLMVLHSMERELDEAGIIPAGKAGSHGEEV